MTIKSVKFETLKPFSFLFALARERVFIESHSIESRCYRTGKYTACRRLCPFYSPEILQAGAVKGLCWKRVKTYCAFTCTDGQRWTDQPTGWHRCSNAHVFTCQHASMHTCTHGRYTTRCGSGDAFPWAYVCVHACVHVTHLCIIHINVHVCMCKYICMV